MKAERDPSADGGKTEAAGGRGSASLEVRPNGGRGSAPLDVGPNSGRGARARFDNTSHAGRRSPVREALRLSGGTDTDRERLEDPDPSLDTGGRPGRLDEAGATAPSKRELDPWAEDEPIFGRREVTHALSPTPGTPPLGNLAVEPPPGWTPDAPKPGATEPATPTGALRVLREPIRIEMELEHCGRWACGLSEKASPRGLEISLGHRAVGTRDFLSAGRRVRLLVSPHGERPFQLQAKILWVDPPSGPRRAVRAQLAVVTKDAGALARWQGLVERSRG